MPLGVPQGEDAEKLRHSRQPAEGPPAFSMYIQVYWDGEIQFYNSTGTKQKTRKNKKTWYQTESSWAYRLVGRYILKRNLPDFWPGFRPGFLALEQTAGGGQEDQGGWGGLGGEKNWKKKH